MFNLINIYNRMLLSHKKECNNFIRRNMEDLEILTLSAIARKRQVSYDIT